jgi:hypothetical protein
MTRLTTHSNLEKNSKRANFLLVVMLSAAALVLIFVFAYFLVGDKGKKLLPGLHHDPQPTSCLLSPSNAIAS